MALLPIPVWTIPPNWSEKVTEGLEWLTSIMASVINAEQRQGLRLSPRRSIEFMVDPRDQWRTYFDALLTTQFQDTFYVPVWYEASTLERSVVTGQSVLPVRGTRTELAAASVVFIQGAQPYLFELVEVTSSSFSGGTTLFELASPLVGSWPRGAKVFPAVAARLSEQPSYQRHSDRALNSNLMFTFAQANDWAGESTLPDYLGRPVADLYINDDGTQKGGYQRIVLNLDNSTGIPLRTDLGGIAFPTSMPSGFFRGRVNADDFRSFLYAMQGRLKSAWFVSPSSDFKLVSSALSGLNHVTVERSGFTDLSGPIEGRRDIRILKRDGAVSYHHITGSALIGATTESLILSPVLSSDLTPANVKRISFMSLGRLDQDRIELVHQTDSDGVCSYSVAVRNVPDLREVDDWFPPPLPLSEEGGCGPTIPGQLWVRLNSGDWNLDPDANPAIGTGGLPINSLTDTQELFPVFGMGTGFFTGGPMTAGFGASAFRKKPPYRAAAWGIGTTLNPADKHPNIILTNGNLSMQVGGEVWLCYVRATTGTTTQGGLRYFEFRPDAALPQDIAVGFATLDFSLDQPLFGMDATGSVLAQGSDGYVYLEGAQIGRWFPGGGLAPGDVISVAIYTGV